MGCASSSPFISTAGNGALKTANDTATKVLHSGEETLTEIKDSLGEKVTHVKDAIVGAAQNVGHEFENAFTSTKQEIEKTETKVEENIEKIKETVTNEEPTEFKLIPLKDPNTTNMIEDTLDDITSKIDDTTAEIKDTTVSTVENAKETIENKMENVKENIDNFMTNSDNTDMQSIDSLKTSTPEPEIERVMSNDPDDNPPTPAPNISELEKLQTMTMKSMHKIEDEANETKDHIKKDLLTAVDSLEKEIHTVISNT